VHTVILQRADHLETRAIADVCQARVLMSAEVAAGRMRPSGVRSNTAPHASNSLTQSGASLAWSSAITPVVDVLPSAHRIGEVHTPTVAIVDVADGCGHAAFSH